METIHQLDTYVINKINFSKQEVLAFPQEMEERSYQIHRGLILGNTSNTISKIRFVAHGELMEIEAIIYAATEKWVILRNELMIPVHCIREVIV